MPPRSSSIDRILAAATLHFAERGYDAASLSEIAEAVGIRKPSLYAHFSGKNDLFLQVFSNALQTELGFVRRCFASEEKSAVAGSRYCSGLARRYASSEHLRFLLRAAYFPPAELREQIANGYQVYLDQLLTEFTEKLTKSISPEKVPDGEGAVFGRAYLGIVDSLHVELLYAGGKSFPDRLHALLRLLEGALSQLPNTAPAPPPDRPCPSGHHALQNTHTYRKQILLQ